MNTSHIKKCKTQRGYTLLFAVLTATLVLGVSVFILSVSTKQYQLAVAARESMYALYAADSAIECVVGAAKFGDISTSLDDNVAPIAPAFLSCYKDTREGHGEANTFDFKFGPPRDPVDGDASEDVFTGLVYEAGPYHIQLAEGTCATVTLRKGQTTTRGMMLIDALGYNYCQDIDSGSPGEPVISTRTVERGLRLRKGI